MKKIYKELTQEQLSRGVIFSSCLSESRNERKEDNIHEVISKKIDNLTEKNNQEETIKRLLNDKFFDNSHFKYNIIRR